MHPTSRMYDRLYRLKMTGFSPANILDLGAYDGDWSRGARLLFPDAHILMVDALDEREENIKEACREIGNADYLIAMIGDRDEVETAFFVVNAAGGEIQTGSSRYSENTGQPIVERKLHQRTIASIVNARGTGFDLVKLDVQGSELDVLWGWGPSLKQVEAILMEISVVPYNLGSPLAQQVFTEMGSQGFTLYDIVDELRHYGELNYLMQFDGLFLRTGSPLLPAPPF